MPIEPEHFQRWLELFIESAQETLPQPQAGQAIAKASHMAQCFEAGMFPFTGANGKPSGIRLTKAKQTRVPSKAVLS